MPVEIYESILNKLLGDAAESALREIGRQETETIKSEISVPVVYGDRNVEFVTQEGERVSFIAHNQVIQRSAPGEPPRLEEGLLHANISWAIEHNDTGAPVLEITSARPPQAASGRNVLRFGGEVSVSHAQGESPASVPQILEFNLNRPYMQPAVERLEGYVLQVFVDHYGRML